MERMLSGIGGTRYILVVDPDVNERYTMSMLLQRFGYTVASAGSVREGIDYLCVAPAVAVFAEAGKIGTELMERIGQDLRFREVPLVLVSDVVREPFLEEQVRQGSLAGVLRSPLHAEAVFQIIQKVVEKGPRRNLRVATALPAVLLDEEGNLDGYITVLSQYGLFFRTLMPRTQGVRVIVEFVIWERKISLEATVLYGVTFDEGPFSDPGMGMKFSLIGAEDSVLLRAFILEQLCGDIIPFVADLGYPEGAA
jgi:CheY-like chemotaxis protein